MRIYKNHIFTKTGKYFQLTQSEAESPPRKYQYRLQNELHEVASTYPEAKSVIKSLIKDYKKQQKILKDRRAEIIRILSKVKKYSEYLLLRVIFMDVYVDIPMQTLQDKIDKLERILSYMEHKNIRAPFDIARAKEVPIENYLTFNLQGKALCLWHHEKTPSMFLNKRTNRVHCFGCGENHSVVDVVMKLFNLDFTQAIKLLNNI